MFGNWISLVVVVSVLPMHVVDTTKAFGCKNSLIPDWWRQNITDAQNLLRRTLALGEATTLAGVRLPKAKQMNELEWDCDLEYYLWSQTQTDVCPTTFKIIEGYGVNPLLIPANPERCNTTAIAFNVLFNWWSQSLFFNPANMKFLIAQSQQFANMATWNASRMACMYAFCPGNVIFLCAYNVGAVLGRAIYTLDDAGPCTSNAACKGLNPTCISRLCKVESDLAPIAPQIFCPVFGMEGELRDVARYMHNYYRRKVATGWAIDKLGRYAPRASKMPKLRYSCGIEAQAYARAKECTVKPVLKLNFTENFLKIDSYTISRVNALRQAINQWFGQLEKYGIGSANVFTEAMNNAKQVTNYVNMMYDQAVAFGCGIQTCTRNGFTIVICQYGNGTVAVNSLIYSKGKPCSACPTGTQCGEWKALCETKSKS